MNLLRVLKAWPWPILVATILTTLSALWFALFSLGAFGRLGMPFFQAVGFPMQLAVIGMGFFLTARLLKNRPESFIQSVPIPVRIIVPLAIALGVQQLSLLPGSMPSKTPSGAPAHSFNASVDDGVCVAVYNQSERVTEPLTYCADYQSHFDQAFAAAWLLFSALELWGAWAIYGAPPVQRIPADYERPQPVSSPLEARAAEVTTRATRPYLWLSVRVAILVYWVVAGWEGFGQQPLPIPTFVLVLAALWGAIATRYWIVQAYTSTKRTEPWLLPSWFQNPFQRSQPFQFFHLGALSFLAFGISHLLREEVSGNHLSLGEWPDELFAAAFGLGILVGIYWAVAAYRSRFQRVTLN